MNLLMSARSFFTHNQWWALHFEEQCWKENLELLACWLRHLMSVCYIAFVKKKKWKKGWTHCITLHVLSVGKCSCKFDSLYSDSALIHTEANDSSFMPDYIPFIKNTREIYTMKGKKHKCMEYWEFCQNISELHKLYLDMLWRSYVFIFPFLLYRVPLI